MINSCFPGNTGSHRFHGYTQKKLVNICICENLIVEILVFEWSPEKG